VALYADIDQLTEADDRVTLMTAHNAKGLEFDLVMVAGLEQGLFPHASSFGDEAEMDEERRLFYVALTRARRQVVLSSALLRLRFGRTEEQELSEFVRALAQQVGDDLEVLNRTEYDDALLLAGERRPAGAGWQTGRVGRHAAGTGASAGWHGGRRSRRRSPLASESLEFDPADEVQLDPEEWGLMVGAPVRHAQFGRGTVVAQDGTGPDARLTVRFEGAVTKRVLARYLSPIEG
jgi:DNA helicase-2/ATP-dependent DNA helicase PcrA